MEGTSHKLDTVSTVSVPQRVLLDWDDLFKRSLFYTPMQQQNESNETIQEGLDGHTGPM